LASAWKAGLLAIGTLALAAPVRASEFDVIINEIHYNVLRDGGEARFEFVELYNRGADAVDLSGWSFSQGLTFTFPDGESIAPKEYLVVSPDPDAAIAAYGLERAAGPFLGRLDNGGEILELVAADGTVINRVHYRDESPWPGRPDGRGPSLEFTGTDNANDRARRWKPSFGLDGTPGASNSRRIEPIEMPQPQVEVLLPEDAVFKTFKGREAPSDPLDAWTALEFDDGGWEDGRSPFGYGEPPGFEFNTELVDMLGGYTTFFLRGRFAVDEATHASVVNGDWTARLSIAYDDAFTAWINGVEIGRLNAGNPGAPIPPNGRAARRDQGIAQLDVPVDALRVGENVVAVVGLNYRVDNPDFFISAAVSLTERLTPETPNGSGRYVGGIINEIAPGDDEGDTGFIELYNPTGEPLDLGGHFLLSGRFDLAYEIPAGTTLSPDDRLAFTGLQMGATVSAEDATYVLLAVDGRTIIDDLEAAPRSGRSFGRYPDGDDDDFVLDAPTLGTANAYTEIKPLVINEISFHPPYVPPSNECVRQCSDADQWIEIHNRSDEPVALRGWRLASAVRYAFEPDASIAPGGYLVVAADAAAFRAAHPEVEAVVGDWQGRLSHASETIVLRNALGNPVDRVEYGDGRPVNDEAPDDDVDDRTFRGSDWPHGPDGDGPTLELANPALSNRSGLAWRASAEPGGTPGTANSTFDAAAAPTVRGIEHSPAVPRSTDDVTIVCRISSVAPLASALVRWEIDGDGDAAEGTSDLVDDGTGVDAAADDGQYSASIPAQADGAIVRFSIEVIDAAAARTRVPLEPEVPPYAEYPGTFLLYEVDDSTPPATGTAVFRLVMTERDRQELRSRPRVSNVLLPATFIADERIRYVAGLRYRGESSRNDRNRSYKIRLPPEKAVEGVDNINLNGGNGGSFGHQTFTELLAADLYRRAGAPYPEEWNISLHFAGEVAANFDQRYIYKEAYDDRFLRRTFGGSDHGNLYRARNPDRGRLSGNLSYRGDDPDAYRALYEKGSNGEADDFSDVMALCALFDSGLTPDEEFDAQIDDAVDARQWANFFAVMACLTNRDGGIWNNNGEDYFLYRVPDDSPRPDAGKWLLLCWDLEESFGSANEQLFRSTVRSIRRFFSIPRHAKLYYEELLAIRAGIFSRYEMRQRYAHADVMFAPADVYNVVDPVDTNVTQRVGFFDAMIPRSIEGGATGSEDEPAGGCSERLYAQGERTMLRGMCDPTTTASIVVVGQAATFEIVHDDQGPWGAQWSAEVTLEPGDNAITVAAFSEPDGAGALVESVDLMVHRLSGGFTLPPLQVDTNTVWSLAESPYRLAGTVRVAAGARLEIDAGVVVLAEADASILVEGQLLANGEPDAPIVFQPWSCAAAWGGIGISGTGVAEESPTHRLRYCEIRGGERASGLSGCVASADAKIVVEDCLFADIGANAIDGSRGRVEVARSEFRDVFEGVHTTSATTIITDSVFAGMIGNSDAIDLDGGGSERSRIQRCTILSSSDDGVDIGAVSVDIRDNVFVGVEDKAISMERRGNLGPPTVTGNLIYRCGTGIAIKNGLEVTEAAHNTVANCQVGVALFAVDLAPDGGHAALDSCIVWGNGIDVAADARSSIRFEYSDISSALWPGAGNVSADPRFVDALGGDYALRADSPCIGTARDGTDMGAIPSGEDPIDGEFLRGDANENGRVDISDAVATLAFLFQGGDGPQSCRDILDANDDGDPNISDAVYTLRYLFSGGTVIPPPYPDAGLDPTPDGMTCVR